MQRRIGVATGVWAGVPIMLVVLATLDALKPTNIPGLPQVPVAALWGLPLDLYVRDMTMALTIGCLLVGGFLVSAPSTRMLQLASLFAGAWWFSVVIQIPLTVSEVLALPLEDSFDVVIVWSLLSQTTLGQVILTQLVLVGVVALLAWVTRGRFGLVVLLVLAAAAAFAPGFTGHSSMGDGHEVATVSLGLHLLAMSAWVGGLVALAALVSVDRSMADGAVRRFSAVALVCVVVLGETGLLNAAMRVESVGEIVTSQYGAILMAKSLILVMLIGFGWRHRELLRTLAVGQARPDSGAYFMRLVGLEVVWMFVAVGLAVALSRTAPPGGVVGDVVAPGVLVLLAVALPVWIVLWFGDRSLRFVSRIAGYPEAVAVAAMLVTVAVGMALPGMGAWAFVGCLLVGVVGWAAVASAVRSRSVVSVVLMMLAWPVMMWWLMRGTAGETALGTWVVVLLAEGLLVLVFRAARAPRVIVQESSERVPA